MNATRKTMGRKRRRSNSEDQNVNRSVRQRLKMSPNEPPKTLEFIQDALTNYLVLRNIFKFVDNWDLVSCCNVSQYWRAVADPLLLPHYDMILYYGVEYPDFSIAESRYSGNNRNIVKVSETARYNRNEIVAQYNSDYSGLTQKLDKVLLTHKISINLKVSRGVNIIDDEVLNLFSKFGFLVWDLSFDSIKMNVVDFCKILVQNFPNIKKLDTAGLHLTSLQGSVENQFFDPDIPQIKHAGLRKISFLSGAAGFDVLSMGTFLKIFENLEEIECFPLALIDVIRISQKGKALKSLSDVFGGTVLLPLYEKLVQLQPKLNSLRFHPGVFSHDPENSFEIFKPCLFSILLSSQESLKFLQIPPVRSDSVQHFPTLERLEELELIQLGCEEGSFFPPKMSLTEKFPHVSKISFSKSSVGYLRRNFPKNIISPWSSQINHLNVGRVYENSLSMLQRLFPHLRGLGIICSANKIPIILPELSRLWPQLNFLSISVGDQCHDKMTYMRGRPLRLDHAFTGLSDRVIDQLLDPSRKKVFTHKEIQKFKNQSIIYKMKELRTLELVLRDCQYRVGKKGKLTYMHLTSVAQQFGFNLLPELKVTAKIDTKRFSREMKKVLEPLTQSGNFEIDD